MEDTESSSSRGSEASPSSSSGGGRRKRRRQKVEVFQEVVRRLKELNIEEAKQPGFEDDLWEHFRKLPLRYAMDVNAETAEDVLMHKRLLHMARDPNTRLAFELRLVQVHLISDGNTDESVHSTFRNREDTQHLGPTCSSIYWLHPPPAFGWSSSSELALGANIADVQDEYSSVSGSLQLFRHEITISTNDKPKLLSQLTSLLSEVGLNIQEAHAFSTRDGYSLDVFIVDGWPYEETDQLKSVLAEEIPKIESQSALKSEPPGDGFGQNGIKLIPSHVDISTSGNDVWKIDVNLLNFGNKIATWSNCDLYKGTFCSQDVAIKVLKAEYVNENVQCEFAQEVYILSKLQHKNIVQFIGACTGPPLLCIVTEFVIGGNVYDFLHKHEGVLKLPAVVKIAIDVSRGMSYLHQNNIIHRDLKSANLLINENSVIKVADFGVARVQDQSGIMTAETGTYRWMAPEVIGHRPYDHKADVFSFGIVLWELLTGKLPYEDLTPLQAALGVFQKGLRPPIPSETHAVLADLLMRCWQQDSTLRPEFSEILEILQHLAEEVGEEERTEPSGKKAKSG